MTNPHPQTAIEVWTKENWADAWTAQPNIEAVSAVESVTPEVPSAILRYHYGSIKRHGATAFSTDAPLDLADYYVKIAADDGSFTWYGVIAQTVSDVQGNDAADPTGVQTFLAYGLEHLLDMQPVVGSYARANTIYGPLDDAYIKRTLEFNIRHRTGGTLLGNRSVAVTGEGNWYFERTGLGVIWTVQNIIDYLLQHFAPAGITWASGGQVADLDQLEEVVQLDGLTVRQALNLLVDRRRGYSWRVVTTGAGAVTVSIFSLYASDVVIGDPIFGDTYTANPNQEALTLDDATEIDQASLRIERQALYDIVRVRGARVKSAFTVCHADGTLEPAWTDALEADYKSGAAAWDDYDTLSIVEKMEANAVARQEDRLARVYTTFKIPYNWLGYVGDAGGGEGNTQLALSTAGSNASPRCNASGVLTPASSAALLYNQDRPILRLLPFQEGRDYSNASWPMAYDDAEQEPAFMKPFALVYGADGRYRFADRLYYDEVPPARVVPGDKESTLIVKFTPQHLLGRTLFEVADSGSGSGSGTGSAAEADMTPSVYNWKQMILTLCIETDVHLEVVQYADGYPIAEFHRTIVIDVPDAEVWYSPIGTVFDVDDEGLPKKTTTSTLFRDDSDRLQTIAGLAVQWYSTPRAAVSLRYNRLVTTAAIGALVTTARIGTGSSVDVNGVVTRRSADFVNQAVDVEIGWWGVDWPTVAPGQNHYFPDMGALTQSIQRGARADTAARGLAGGPA